MASNDLFNPDDPEVRRSISLLLADVLGWTPELSVEQVAVVRQVLIRLAHAEQLTGADEEEIFSLLLDAGFEVTPPFNPETWRRLIDKTH